jgi:hypothetical protein
MVSIRILKQIRYLSSLYYVNYVWGQSVCEKCYFTDLLIANSQFTKCPVTTSEIPLVLLESWLYCARTQPQIYTHSTAATPQSRLAATVVSHAYNI